MSDLHAKSKLLRRAMQLNGGFSALSGLVFLTFSEQLAALQGLEAEWAAQFVQTGLVLLVFAAFLFASTHFLREKRSGLLVTGSIAVALDLVYVVGAFCAVALDAPPTNLAGKWMDVILAVFVLDFAVFQFLGLKRIWRQVPDPGEAHAVVS